MAELIKNEKDVRKWVRDNFDERAKFIEPSMGSTKGIPDCYLLLGFGAILFVELKVGELIGDGMIKTDVRPAQRKEIVDLFANDSPVGMLVGVLGTDKLILTKSEEEMISGRISIPKKGKAHTSIALHNTMSVATPSLFRALFFWHEGVSPADWAEVNEKFSKRPG